MCRAVATGLAPSHGFAVCAEARGGGAFSEGFRAVGANPPWPSPRPELRASLARLEHTAGMPLPTPTLNTPRLRLRPFAQTDTDAIFALQSNPRVLRYWDEPAWKTRSQAERSIVRCGVRSSRKARGARLAIERGDDSAFIGWCGIWRMESGSIAARGWATASMRAAWGQGFATEAADAVLQWAFDTLDLNRVQAENRHPQYRIEPCAGEARLCPRRHVARRLHRGRGGFGFLGLRASRWREWKTSDLLTRPQRRGGGGRPRSGLTEGRRKAASNES